MTIESAQLPFFMVPPAWLKVAHWRVFLIDAHGTYFDVMVLGELDGAGVPLHRWMHEHEPETVQ